MLNKKIYGLIGYPVSHSLSAFMHNAAFKNLGINAEYKLFEVKPQKLKDFLNSLSEQNIYGLNVTIPHKIAAYNFIKKNGKLNPEAEKVCAVNTIIVKRSRLIGDNTDGRGFIASLQKDLSFNPKDKTICIVGAGGAARSIIMQLENRPKKIYVFGIIKKQLDKLEGNYKRYYDEKKIKCMKKNKRLRTPFVRKSDLFINATPIGMKHMKGCVIEKEALHNNLVVYDVIYNPPETELLALAKKKGIRYSNGLGMLIYQGALSFKLWTGKNAPIDIMKKVVIENLKCS